MDSMAGQTNFYSQLLISAIELLLSTIHIADITD